MASKDDGHLQFLDGFIESGLKGLRRVMGGDPRLLVA